VGGSKARSLHSAGRYSCGVIETLPPQVALRQSADVDYVSRATQSADAFYEAAFAALNKV
jgi:uncharacterized protein with FMN-binding domain